MTARDYAADFAAFLVKYLPASEYVPAVAASEVVERLREEDPDLLAGWLDARATVVLTDFIGCQLRSTRSATARQAGAVAFAEAVTRHEAGEPGAFDAVCVVNADNLRRRIGDMTKADHLFVAEQHEHRSRAALFEATFHRAVAKRIPAGKTTQAVLGEEEYLRLRYSISQPRRAQRPAA